MAMTLDDFLAKYLNVLGHEREEMKADLEEMMEEAREEAYPKE